MFKVIIVACFCLAVQAQQYQQQSYSGGGGGGGGGQQQNYIQPQQYQPRNLHPPASVHYVNIGQQLQGDYKFGYDTGKGPSGQSFREETRLPDGSVKGAYGYVDASGQQRIIKYTAGKTGFSAEGDGVPRAPAAAAPVQAAPAQQYRPPPQQQYNPPPQQQYNPPPQQQQYNPPTYSSRPRYEEDYNNGPAFIDTSLLSYNIGNKG